MVKIMFICEKLRKKWSAYATCMPSDISLPEVKTVEYVVYVKPVRHGADAAGASKKEKKENTKVDIAAAATA